MKTILKSLLVWLLLLAVPFQGFASATMLVCAPFSSMPMPSSTNVPAAADQTMASEAGTLSEHCAAMAARHHNDTEKKKSGHDSSTKCDSCASCHVGAALTSSDANSVPVETQQFHAIPFARGFAAVVDLDLPERPPQA